GELCAPAPHGGLKEWNKQTLEEHWLPFDQLLQLPTVELQGRDMDLFSNGQCLTREQYNSLNGEVWVTKGAGELMALGQVDAGVLKSAIMFPGGAPSTIVDKSKKLSLSH